MQLVWWPTPRDWHLAFIRDEDAMQLIYCWRLLLGPLEVRRWRHATPADVEAYNARKR